MKYQFFIPPKDSTVWVISDTHGFHKNITSGVTSWNNKTGCRQFENEVLMTEHLCNNINKVVMSQDYLLHLGDWSFGGKDKVPLLRSMINCQNIAITLGNHDHWIRREESYEKLFTWIGEYNEFRFHKTLVCLFHYPISSWREMADGAVHLHGHCHGSYRPKGRMMDVGVDCTAYQPLLLDDVVNGLKLKEIPTDIDHHTDPSRK